MQHKSYYFQPFVRLVIPFILGIITQKICSFQHTFVLYLFFAFLLLFFFSFFITKYRQINIHGILVFLTFFLLGMLIFKPHLNTQKLPNDKQLFVAHLLKIPNEKDFNYRADLQVEAIKTNDDWELKNFIVSAYFEKDSSVGRLKAGEQIIFFNKLENIQDKKNPFDFDYKQYMYLKNIEKTVYLKSEQWIPVSKNYIGIKQKALNVRQQLINIFSNSGISGRQLSVFSALTLGYKNKLDSQIKKAYSGAGAMHVLAVSGMHVGIIFLVLNGVFSLLFFFNKRGSIKYLIIIICLWAYAFLTGLSTSVLRATLMLTFILIGHLFKKRINVYNSLSASALFLLLLNPNSLFELSFQLSYIAVLGIVFFYSKIYNLIKAPTFVFNKLWELTAVSLSAQLVTFPIGLYYFHQFSTYFCLSNIVVSIAAVVLMLGGIVLVAVSPFAYLSGIVGMGLNYVVDIVNSFVLWVNNLPYAVLSSISLDAVQVFVIYAIIISLSFWFLKRRFGILLTTLLSVLVLVGYNSYKKIVVLNQQTVCVYNVPKTSAIHFINKQKSFWIYAKHDSLKKDFTDKANLFWKTTHNTNITDIDSVKVIDNKMFTNKFFVKSDKYTCFVIDENTLPFYTNIYSDSIFVDFVLIRGNTYLKPKDLPKILSYKKIVIDASVPPWISQKWQKMSNVHNTKKDGAYILQAE